MIVGDGGPQGEGKHILYDGIRGSSYMELACIHHVDSTQQTSASTCNGVQLWIIDNLHIGKRRTNLDSYAIEIFANSSAPVLIVDFSDDPYWDFKESYIDTMNLRSNPRVRIARRSIVVNRHWMYESGMDLGLVRDNHGTAAGPILHMSYCVRNDIVQEIMLQTSSPLETHRPLDVVHLWDKDKSYSEFGEYRNQVSALVQNMDGHIVNGKRLSISTKVVGGSSHEGRRFAHEEYVATLLRSKIVVVTQRDMWEDSYRLMEAFASGAMVLADFMLAPPRGILDGLHLKFFSSTQELEKLITYYLFNEQDRGNISESGFREAMIRHRAWHRLDEVVFGVV
jgi:hypothetical protein